MTSVCSFGAILIVFLAHEYSAKMLWHATGLAHVLVNAQQTTQPIITKQFACLFSAIFEHSDGLQKRLVACTSVKQGNGHSIINGLWLHLQAMACVYLRNVTLPTFIERKANDMLNHDVSMKTFARAVAAQQYLATAEGVHNDFVARLPVSCR